MARKALLFALVALAQLAVLAWIIIDHQRVRSEGAVFKFRTAPVDPRDPFRGEYVRLDFEVEQGRWPVPKGLSDGGTSARAFALVGTDGAGFARIDGLVAEEPASGAYVAIEYMSWTPDTLFGIDLPFDRFYLEEGDGRRTEELLAPQWDNGERAEPMAAYALVRILNGKAVIEDLIVGDKSIFEWLKEEPNEAPAESIPAASTSVPSGS